MQLAVGEVERLIFGEVARVLRLVHRLAAEVDAQGALDYLRVGGAGLIASRVFSSKRASTLTWRVAAM